MWSSNDIENESAYIIRTRASPPDSIGDDYYQSLPGEEILNPMVVIKNPLSRKTIYSYGVGHMLNDLTAACWFTYLLVYLTDIGLNPGQAAVVLMAGQLADALATIVVGRQIDKFGHYKYWHGFGSILVAVSFSSVFGGCLFCSKIQEKNDRSLVLRYSFFAAVFNCGWAATQVSHMALVNCITANPSSRVSLNSCKTAFTMVANLGLFGIAYFVFLWIPSSSSFEIKEQFKWIAGVSIGIGLIFVLLFQIGVHEPQIYSVNSCEKDTLSWDFWFGKILYFQVALVYTLTRLASNVSQALLPFYLVNDLFLPHSSKALVPALVYSSSFLTSLLLQEWHWSSKRLKFAFGVGTLCWNLSGVIIFVLWPSSTWQPYLVACLMGIGTSLIIVSATSMAGILVSTHLNGCAFVYGSLSFYDKLSCGIVLFLIESFNDSGPGCKTPGINGCRRSLVRWMITLLPSLCTTAALLVSLSANLTEDSNKLTQLLPSRDVEKNTSQGVIDNLSTKER